MSGMSRWKKKYQIKATVEKNHRPTNTCACITQDGATELSREVSLK